jgi:tetratricopeptide (TPR) repeat protein
MEFPSKRRLARAFAANAFLRLFILDSYFRVAVLSLVLLALLFAGCLPRIWTVSPRGFLPTIKVSGLDLAQCWNLKRSAAKAMATEKWRDAHFASLAAWANNSADPEALRGVLTSWIKSGERGQSSVPAAWQSLWLLRLTATNVVDLQLATQVFEESGNLELIVDLLAPRTGQLPDRLEALYLKTLFQYGDTKAFCQAWDALPDSARFMPELQLYHAACTAMVGPLDARQSAVELLRQATNIAELSITGLRLQVKVSETRSDAEGCQAALAHLSDSGSDRFSDHFSYWRLLVRLGRHNEAIERIAACGKTPAFAQEAISLAQLYIDLGMGDRAFEYLKSSVSDFGFASNYWIFYGDALLKAGRWDDLRRVALELRQRNRDWQLIAYGYYLEGRAELGLQRKSAALSAFEKMREWKFTSCKLALHTAAALIRIDYPAIAVQILRPLEAELSDSVEYWMSLFFAAHRLKDHELMLTASSRAYELQPSHSIIRNNYAASLLISRQSPEEALTLTLRVTTQEPGSLPAVINYGAALIQNHRLMEAENVFSGVDTNRLSRPEAALYFFDLFELRLKARRFSEAEQIGRSINTEHLYPPQREWLERTLREIATSRRG